MYSHCQRCLNVVKRLVNLCEQILTFKKINLKDRDFPVIHFGVSFGNSCTFSSHHTIPDQIHHHHHLHPIPAVFGGITTNAGLWQKFWEPTLIALSPFTIRSSQAGFGFWVLDIQQDLLYTIHVHAHPSNVCHCI